MKNKIYILLGIIISSMEKQFKYSYDLFKDGDLVEKVKGILRKMNAQEIFNETELVSGAEFDEVDVLRFYRLGDKSVAFLYACLGELDAPTPSFELAINGDKDVILEYENLSKGINNYLR